MRRGIEKVTNYLLQEIADRASPVNDLNAIAKRGRNFGW
jgi:hypothetical protein